MLCEEEIVVVGWLSGEGNYIVIRSSRSDWTQSVDAWFSGENKLFIAVAKVTGLPKDDTVHAGVLDLYSREQHSSINLENDFKRIFKGNNK